MAVHVMLDLETLGTLPGCAILSVGACVFDPNAPGHVLFDGESFSRNITRRSCELAGLTVDPDTEKWWNRQSIAAREAVAKDGQPLISVMTGFNWWFFAAGARYLWCHGASFDEPIWRAAAKATGLAIPWRYWNVRDTRTVLDIAGVNLKQVARDGEAHDALADARHQARGVQLAYSKLRRSTWPPPYVQVPPHPMPDEAGPEAAP